MRKRNSIVFRWNLLCDSFVEWFINIMW